MTRHHDHHHGPHGSDAPTDPALPFEEKLTRRLEHWIRHNADHASSYRDWAAQAHANGFPEAGTHLEKAVELTEAVTLAFQAALTCARNGK